MKRRVAVLLLAVLLVLQIFYGCDDHTKAENDSFLRVHVRADSDSAQAQAVKIRAVAAVERVLTEALADCPAEALLSRAEALLPQLTSVAVSAVKSAGAGYGVQAYVGKEAFPACTLSAKTYPAGTYDALVILLGTGQGANWWSVLYPQSGNGEYRSFLAELFTT